ncbi:hypothetical protein L1049_006658 [Liquidambar formosana]|uniref:MULE transposase domain-containing protein n=1 Tax=Liquidambar formosana TaxID=63359 RepID=A0AAP0WRP2_LIQFO
MVEVVRDKPLLSTVEVRRDFKRKYGLDIFATNTWMGIEKVRTCLYDDNSKSFDQLRWFIEESMRTNPGSKLVLDMDECSNQFKRFFASFYACIHGFTYCRPMLFVDDTFLKRDARLLTFISDRNNGLKLALPKNFLTAYHAYCLHHLQMNLRDKVRGHKSFKDRMVFLFRECANAPTEHNFEEKLSELLAEGKDQVQFFLDDYSFQCWENAYFQRQRYSEMCSNIAESFNAWIKEARFLPITNMVDLIRSQIMAQMCNRRLEADSWNIVLCPKMDERLGEELDKGRT